jgi:hypothetical protein
MDKNKKGLTLGLEQKPMSEQERQRIHAARLFRRRMLTIIAIVAAITIIAQMVLQYYMGLHR